MHVGNSSQIYEHDHDIHRKLKLLKYPKTGILGPCGCGCRKSPTKEEIDPRKFRSSARRRRLGIAGIGVTGRCALKILGPFEVSYIPPGGDIGDIGDLKWTHNF